jgi:hypothetical protein
MLPDSRDILAAERAARGQETVVEGDVVYVADHGTIVQVAVKDAKGDWHTVHFDARSFRNWAGDRTSVVGLHVVVHGDFPGQWLEELDG